MGSGRIKREGEIIRDGDLVSNQRECKLRDSQKQCAVDSDHHRPERGQKKKRIPHGRKDENGGVLPSKKKSKTGADGGEQVEGLSNGSKDQQSAGEEEVRGGVANEKKGRNVVPGGDGQLLFSALT